MVTKDSSEENHARSHEQLEAITTNEELPPSYEQSVVPDSVASESVAPLSPVSSTSAAPLPPLVPTPPHDAQRAIAPLSITETSKAIKGVYAVRLSASKRGPDVHLSTTNGSVVTTFYLQGTLDRPAEVDVHSTNGKVNLSIPGREAALDVSARTTNGGLVCSLPHDFDGLVSLRTTNGSKKLAGSMTGVIWPNEDSSDSKTVTYRVRPRPNKAGKGKGKEKENREEMNQGERVGEGVGVERRLADLKIDPDVKVDGMLQEQEDAEEQSRERARIEAEWNDDDPGPDRARLSTTNGSVKAQYEGDVEESKNKCEGKDSSCVVM